MKATKDKSYRLPRNSLFAIAAAQEIGDKVLLIGTAIAIRPTKGMDDGETVELKDIHVTKEYPESCMKLYKSCQDVAFAMGCNYLVSYLYDVDTGKTIQEQYSEYKAKAEKEQNGLLN